MTYKPQWSTSRLDVCIEHALLSRSEYRCLRTELLRALAKARAVLHLRDVDWSIERVLKNLELMLLIMIEYIEEEGKPIILP